MDAVDGFRSVVLSICSGTHSAETAQGVATAFCAAQAGGPPEIAVEKSSSVVHPVLSAAAGPYRSPRYSTLGAMKETLPSPDDSVARDDRVPRKRDVIVLRVAPITAVRELAERVAGQHGVMASADMS